MSCFIADSQQASDNKMVLVKARLSEYRQKIHTDPELLQEYKTK